MTPYYHSGSYILSKNELVEQFDKFTAEEFQPNHGELLRLFLTSLETEPDHD